MIAITILHGATTILCKGLSNLLQVLNYTFGNICATVLLCDIPTARQVQDLLLKMAPFNNIHYVAYRINQFKKNSNYVIGEM